jgi:hypothetical protein
MSKATTEALDELHGLVAKVLAARLKDGTATAADIAQATKFLKDNGIEVGAAPPGSPLGQLRQSVADNLPFPDAGGPAH